MAYMAWQVQADLQSILNHMNHIYGGCASLMPPYIETTSRRMKTSPKPSDSQRRIPP